ncbi:hypothetical protein [Arcicella rigui]|uniref:Uncharacterized protein n=1 Tax=Arcicella rigui TaxID=797020 RepID=A0ABU5QC04_9BACT|nr:hypothetical protein [Arcicella rigui]MEA5140162.1 hypothetical protein [Arcicella rigui]
MIKAISKYLLSICILLLGVTNHLHAQKQKDSAFYSPIKPRKDTRHASLNTQHRNLTSVATSTSFDNRVNIVYGYSEEHEEDEKECIASHKKNIAKAYFHSAYFYNWYTKLFLFNTSQVLHFGKHFSQYPLNKLFVVFRVFRI